MKYYNPEEYEDYSNFVFYHGTSSALDIPVLLPAAETGTLREEWRTKMTHKVFFTDSLLSARQYAKKAAKKYGGDPVVYVVKPNSEVWHINNTEYVADSANILRAV